MGKILELVVAVLTAIPSLVQAAEALHDRSGAGAQKKLFVLDAIHQLIAVAQASDPKVAKALTPDVLKQIDTVSGASVDAAVSVMNAAGPTP